MPSSNTGCLTLKNACHCTQEVVPSKQVNLRTLYIICVGKSPTTGEVYTWIVDLQHDIGFPVLPHPLPFTPSSTIK